MKTGICSGNAMCVLFSLFLLTHAEVNKDKVDEVIEDEITHRLSEDLLQSIEKKFQVDLEKSVDSVLTKIKLLLQNGTFHIQEKFSELQTTLEVMKKESEELVGACLLRKQNETTDLAEKALHQMVVCGYALIGHDPAQAVKNVLALKTMIKRGLEPIYEQRKEVYNLLKVCGHDHDTLKKVIKCVISKSPQLKAAMMGVSGRLVDGVVQLTKLMAHGAMHEACLIEVIRTVEDEAFLLVNKVKKCVNNDTDVDEETNKFIQENNATVLDIERTKAKPFVTEEERKVIKKAEEASVKEMKEMLRRMIDENQNKDVDKMFKGKMKDLENVLKAADSENSIGKGDNDNKI